jgi:hypothetical protein
MCNGEAVMTNQPCGIRIPAILSNPLIPHTPFLRVQCEFDARLGPEQVHLLPVR